MGKKAVVAIGVFDGVHLGHRRILKAAVRIARGKNTKAIAVTFYPHPLSVVGRGNVAPSLISLKHRLNLIKQAGVDRCLVFNFTKSFAEKPAQHFIKNILIRRLAAGWVVVGEDFRFGKNRQGNCALLYELGKRLGFTLKRVKTLKIKGMAVSSSAIRRLVQKGDLKTASRLLGRPVTVFGTVVKGNNIGRKLGFPTANINPHHEVVPPSGVYVVKVIIDKRRYNGVLNIGIRPTFYGLGHYDKEPSIEAYIFNFSKNIYGKDIEVSFTKKLRAEKKFKNEGALKIQINKDIIKARR